MTESSMNPKVDEFLSKEKKWRPELTELRRIIQDCGLTEEVKWGVPCYTFQKKNIVLIHGFKEYCAILFTKGSLLRDEQGVLIQQTENVQGARQIRFTALEEITALASTIKAYVQEAVEVEKAGVKVPVKEHTEWSIPEELQQKFDESPALMEAFKALTPGRQRAYILYFSDPKQSKTRVSRIEKYEQHILNGKGLQD